MRRTTEAGGYTRTILPPRSPMWPPLAFQGRPPFGGDELRVREFLRRVLGVGAAAAGRRNS